MRIGAVIDTVQRQDLSRRLRARYAELSREVADAQRDIADPAYAGHADQVHDRQEEASGDVLEDVRVADLRRDEGEMRDIESTLARMHEDRFGQCVDCGEPIAPGRLQAFPTAKRCRGCQEKYEQRAGTPRPVRF